MSDRPLKLESGVTDWFAREHDALAWIVGRVLAEQPHAVGELTISRDDDGDIAWEFIPEGWTPCDGNCPTGTECDTHVPCDDNCLALLEPETIPEFRAALEHWRDHDVNSGCSHGC